MRVIHCSGTPSARGEAVGVALRSEIEASVSFTMAWAADFGADRRRVEALLAPYDAANARHASDLAEVLDGMARGSGVDPVALRATNAFEELYALLDPEALGAPAERCPTRCWPASRDRSSCTKSSGTRPTPIASRSWSTDPTTTSRSSRPWSRRGFRWSA
jgi:hypothetical protein